MIIKDKFKIGDHVSWNSEAGRVSGVIVRVHTRNFDLNGYTHHASAIFVNACGGGCSVAIPAIDVDQ
jgi:hypothetical protein